MPLNFEELRKLGLYVFAGMTDRGAWSLMGKYKLSQIMRQWWIAAAILLLTVGCGGSGGQPTAPNVSKQAFLHELVASCATVNQRLQYVDTTKQPGQVAEQLNLLVMHTRSRPTPAEDRRQLDMLLSALGDTAKSFQAAQTALASGDTQKAVSAQQEASEKMVAADRAAVQYGMPPLDKCDETLRGTTGSIPAGAWRAGQDSPIRVQQVGAAVVGGRIYVVGGLTDGGPSRKIQIFDPTIRTWTNGPDLPTPLHHAMVVGYQGRLIVMGGWQPRGDDVSAVISDQVFALGDANTWEPLPSLNHPRAAGAAAVAGDKIVLVGGRTNDALVPATEVFNGTDWRDGAEIPTPRDHLAAVSNGSYLYAVGGRKLKSSENTAAVERYDPESDRWVQLPSMPTARGGLGAAIVGGRILAVGGEAPTSVYRTVESYDMASATWSAGSPLPIGRHGLAVAAVGDSLYAIDGAAHPGHQESSATVQILNLNISAATPRSSAPTTPPAPPTSSLPATTAASPPTPAGRIDVSSTPSACSSSGGTVACLELVTLTSSGTRPVQLQSIDIPLSAGTVTAPPSAPSGQAVCAAGVQLNPGQSCTFQVVFYRVTTLTIHDNIPSPDKGVTLRLAAPNLPTSSEVPSAGPAAPRSP